MSDILLPAQLCRARGTTVLPKQTLSSALYVGEGLLGTMNAEVSVAAGTPGRSTG